MKKTYLYIITVIISSLLLLQLVMASVPATFERDQLVIRTINGEQTYNVEIATTGKQLTQGLMYRNELPENEGMLFIFPKEQVISMWMKNTLIPLDMLFIDIHGKIVYIKQNAVPGSREFIKPGMPALAVLELKGGIAEKNQINVGDMVIYKAFKK